MAQNNFLTCPADCDDDLLLGAIGEEQGCTSYSQTKSQICDLIIKPNTSSIEVFTDWATTPTLTADGIDNTVTDNSAAKHMVGIGDVADPEENELAYPKGQLKVEDRLYTLAFTCYNMNAAEYALYRQLQCGSTDFTFHYADLGGFVYGAATGIIPKSVTARMPKGRGDNDRNLCNIIIKWEADGDPERKVSPLA